MPVNNPLPFLLEMQFETIRKPESFIKKGIPHQEYHWFSIVSLGLLICLTSIDCKGR